MSSKRYPDELEDGLGGKTLGVCGDVRLSAGFIGNKRVMLLIH
jgi:hypothetical protein